MSSEIIEKLVTDFNNLNKKCDKLIEENRNFKQQNQNLLQENQNLKQKIQFLNEKFQEKDNQYIKLEQHVKNFEGEKSEELRKLRQLEIISQNLQNKLEITDSNEENDNSLPDKNIEQQLQELQKLGQELRQQPLPECSNQ
ncbi:unnamed protein product [Rhizophagus irregularis]|uniref:Uncharacterized protein n=1 Tax=Rhizophagus irregularis TaxID=588596 RepID=A0A2N1N1E2_9GLOM|nr:hypothetical protein RhiirC2_783158 [Rhizophagus irregularis]CAB4381779.1 unnamed protein product [Rhizophagus irregularis]CAB5355984.1 unnamed protein product [Rhizophagus irregularis]